MLRNLASLYIRIKPDLGHNLGANQWNRVTVFDSIQWLECRRHRSSEAKETPTDPPAVASKGTEDSLFRLVEIEARGHDQAVLRSYKTFTLMAANELGIKCHKTFEPWRHIKKKELLRSVFVNKKCREQYEWRTYFSVMQFKFLTGSTLDTFLEYVERNLPEGVALKVEKHRLERMPQHLVPPPLEAQVQQEMGHQREVLVAEVEMVK